MKKIYSFLILGLTTLSLSAQTYNGGTWYSLYQNSEYNQGKIGTLTQTFDVFAPTKSSMSFQYKNKAFFIPGTYGSIELTMYESTNGSSYDEGDKFLTIDVNDNKTSYQNGSYTIKNPSKLQKLKFDLYTSYGAWVSYLKLPMAQHILLADGTTAYEDAFDFGSVQWGSTSTAVDEIALRSFLTAGNITITSSLPTVFRINSADNTQGATFKVGANAFACSKGSEGTPCAEGTIGDINLYGFKIYFCPQEVKTYNGTITITDGTSTATIAVTGKGIKQDQTITFEPAEQIYDTATIAPAVASSGLEVDYTFDPEDVIYWDGSQFVIRAQKDAVQVSIKAEQTGNGKYNAAKAVEKTITIYPSKTYGTYAATVCPGEQVEFYGQQYGAGEHKNILITDKNRFGSDSLVTLTVNEYTPVPETNIYDTTYVGVEIEIAGQYYTFTAKGDTTINDTAYTIHGCDSIIAYHINIKENTATAIEDTDESKITNQNSKIIKDGNLYIRRDQDLFDLQGNKVQ